jgi:hypothetical protein
VKQKDIATLVAVAGVTALFSFVISILLFSPPKHNAQVPSVLPVASGMPDIKNDPNYNTIFNDNALDPSQPVQIGGNSNSTPFSAAPQ